MDSKQYKFDYKTRVKRLHIFALHLLEHICWSWSNHGTGWNNGNGSEEQDYDHKWFLRRRVQRTFVVEGGFLKKKNRAQNEVILSHNPGSGKKVEYVKC